MAFISQITAKKRKKKFDGVYNKEEIVWTYSCIFVIYGHSWCFEISQISHYQKYHNNLCLSLQTFA